MNSQLLHDIFSRAGTIIIIIVALGGAMELFSELFPRTRLSKKWRKLRRGTKEDK